MSSIPLALVFVSIPSSYKHENIIPVVEGGIMVWGFAASEPEGKITSQLAQ